MTADEATHPDALTIAELYARIHGALDQAFPRQAPLWVRGEVHTMNDRTGHCYIDLVDPETARVRDTPVLKVVCWRRTWGTICGQLRRAGVSLEPGMVVFLRGSIDFYRPRGTVNFVLAEVDVTALLGRLAAQRAALLQALEAEGLLRRNKALPAPAVPLHVGLVASPDTEGCRDFLGQLRGSGFSFQVSLVPVPVQGPAAPRALARGVARAAASGCDLVVVVRGGGAKSDLVPFDAEPLARAIATCRRPVWTGVGHTGDESVADLVAQRAHTTPTQCGQAVVASVAAFWADTVVDGAARLLRGAAEAVTGADRDHTRIRGRLAATARQHLRGHRQGLAGRAATLSRAAPRSLEAGRTQLDARRQRIGPSAHQQVERAADRLATWRRLLSAYDVDRQLERGYTLTLDAEGKLLRRAGDAAPGTDLVTRFADGTVRSTVEGGR